MKRREVAVHEVVIRFEVPEYEIDVASYGSGSTPTRFKAGKITLSQALAEVLATAIEGVLPPEGLRIEVDGSVVLSPEEAKKQ